MFFSYAENFQKANKQGKQSFTPYKLIRSIPIKREIMDAIQPYLENKTYNMKRGRQAANCGLVVC